MTNKEKQQIKRDLNPHKAAVVAMALFNREYAKQGGGSMQFYDSLSDDQKKTCREIVTKIESAPDEPNGV